MLVFQCLKRALSIKNVHQISRRSIGGNISSDFILQSDKRDLNFPNITLPEFLTSFQTKFEKYVALECAETKRKYTYGDIRDQSTFLSRSLRKILKLESEDVVALVLRNIPEFPIAYIGVMKANLIVTTVSSSYTAAEIYRQLIDSGTKAIITEVDLYHNVKAGLEIAKKNIPILVIKTKQDQTLPENTINFHEFVSVKSEYPEIIPCNPNAVAVMPYSSGTTGLPKGVELTHKNLVSNILQSYNCDLDFQAEATDSHQEILPTILPYYHIFGLGILNGAHLVGGKMVLLPSYSQDLFVSVLKNHRSTLLYLVPPLVLMLTYHDGVKKEHLSGVKAILSGGAPLASSDEQHLLQKFGRNVHFLQGYSLTETSFGVTQLYPSIMVEAEFHKGSIGKPLPNTRMKIVDPEDSKNIPLGPNTTGELLINGPQIMKGYHNLPKETKNIFTEDGWLRSGDLGHYNEKGFLFITDRLKELIKVKGNQVAPSELEGVIRSFPGIVDAAVIGIPHETAGEVPRAYIVTEKRLDTKKLQEFFNERVARYKELKGGIAIVKSIPKNAAGKILRRELKAMYLEEKI